MSFKAVVYGGMRIVGSLPPKCASSFDGVWMDMRGSTLRDGKWVDAGMTVEMSQSDALNMAMALFLAAEKHSEYSSKAQENFVKRLSKRMARKESNHAKLA